jgi:3-oxoacyl-(acyl-carrier-protein) synthase
MKEVLATTIRGAGMVGPFGVSVPETWQAVAEGRTPASQRLENPVGSAALWGYGVPAEATAQVARLPRLRRSSPISLHAVAAARLALAEAGWTAADFAARAGMILFVASDGSVRYTRRFFEGVENGGPGAGSPLLFPETVYNAPASHVAADLGFGGPSLTLVGDAAIALEACHQAARSLRAGEADAVLIVAAEEVDAIACAGYAAWGLAREGEPGNDSPGCVFSEGAGALLLTRETEEPGTRLETTPGHSHARVGDGGRQLRQELAFWRGHARQAEAVFSSDSGTWIGRKEDTAIQAACPGLSVISIKRMLGEGLSAATLWQIILARHWLEHNSHHQALITCLGLNGQSATAALCRHPHG